jgi:hypothetical protein
MRYFAFITGLMALCASAFRHTEKVQQTAKSSPLYPGMDPMTFGMRYHKNQRQQRRDARRAGRLVS